MEKRKRSIDMLSGLPDEILFHILSFLPTKLSVSTSVLAKRWKFLWTHVSNLEFHENDFKVKKKKQLDIINRVIILHQAKILNTFKLSELKGCAYQLETLIIYPITRGVRNLYLELGYHCEDDIVCTVPRLLFTCKTLVDLKVVNCGRIPSTGEFFLPSLKKLNLTYVEYESDESLPHLLSGCPVLEELIVDDVHRDEQKYSGCFTISSPTIKTLNVNFSIGIEYNPQKTLIIDVPALIYLKVICYDLEYVKSLRKPMTSLSEAEITFDGNSHRCHIDCKEHCRSIEFLSCLSHVRYLKFSSPDAEMLFDIVGTGPITKFVNLTKLELDLPFNWHHVVKFLEVADNLEVLFVSEFGIFNLPYIEVGSFYLLVYHFFGHRVNAREMLPFKEPKRVPPCMLSRLRTVRMYYFSACQDSLDIVRYILMNALVLERMEIDPLFKSSEEKLDALQRIALFERASKSCKVAFNTDEIVRDMIKLEDAKKCRFYSFE